MALHDTQLALRGAHTTYVPFPILEFNISEIISYTLVRGKARQAKLICKNSFIWMNAIKSTTNSNHSQQCFQSSDKNRQTIPNNVTITNEMCIRECGEIGVVWVISVQCKSNCANSVTAVNSWSYTSWKLLGNHFFFLSCSARSCRLRPIHSASFYGCIVKERPYVQFYDCSLTVRELFAEKRRQHSTPSPVEHEGWNFTQHYLSICFPPD